MYSTDLGKIRFLNQRIVEKSPQKQYNIQSMFDLHSNYQPAGDQPKAIEQLTQNYMNGQDQQVLLGVTGSGKTFTMANVIKNIQKPTLVIAHNKTLAAQLYQEFRDFFPNNAVSYFVSYYDFYQPEAYIVSTDTYIEKEAEINEEIDKLRLAATANLLSRPDCIVISSVSCIYNLGRPEDFQNFTFDIVEGEVISRQTLLARLIDMQYIRSTADLLRRTVRVRGENIQIWPANEEFAYNIVMPGDIIERIERIDPTSGELWPIQQEGPAYEAGNRRYTIYPAKHYIADNSNDSALKQIEADLRAHLEVLKAEGKVLEAYRLEQRTLHDIDMLREVGYINGIENYSRYFDGRKPGEAPFTLINYLLYNAKKFGDGKFLTIIDESHITVPQVRGMFNGDQARKKNLIEYGFRLPSAADNRPLRFDEFQDKMRQVMYVSATPTDWEIQASENAVVEQIVRPTGLVDPPVEIRPVAGQVPNLVNEIIQRKKLGQRVLVTTLTKRMAETLTDYLNDQVKMNKLLAKNGFETTDILPKVQYLHSDIETLERSDILDDLRRGEYDVLIGVNLLREGLDLPEVTLVAILDADQEGFLRSRSSLIQTMGRAARHVEGRAILYADRITGSMKEAIEEVERRREIQLAYNEEHGIDPATIMKPIRERMIKKKEEEDALPGVHEVRKTYGHERAPKRDTTGKTVVQLSKKRSVVLEDLDANALTPKDREQLVKQLNRSMNQASKDWNFELAAQIRDTIAKIST
jgi:excinuclease ABC subunit B